MPSSLSIHTASATQSRHSQCLLVYRRCASPPPCFLLLPEPAACCKLLLWFRCFFCIPLLFPPHFRSLCHAHEKLLPLPSRTLSPPRSGIWWELRCSCLPPRVSLLNWGGHSPRVSRVLVGGIRCSCLRGPRPRPLGAIAVADARCRSSRDSGSAGDGLRAARPAAAVVGAGVLPQPQLGPVHGRRHGWRPPRPGLLPGVQLDGG